MIHQVLSPSHSAAVLFINTLLNPNADLHAQLYTGWTITLIIAGISGIGFHHFRWDLGLTIAHAVWKYLRRTTGLLFAWLFFCLVSVHHFLSRKLTSTALLKCRVFSHDLCSWWRLHTLHISLWFLSPPGGLEPEAGQAALHHACFRLGQFPYFYK